MKKLAKMFSAALVLLLVAGLLPGTSLTAYAEQNDDTVLYFETEDLDGWTFIDANNSGQNWVWSKNNPGQYDYDNLAHEGTGFIMSYSFVDYYGAYNIDNWAISPKTTLPGDAASVHFYAQNANADYPEPFSVYVSTSPDPDLSTIKDTDWVLVLENKSVSTGYDSEWTPVEIDLSAYAGQTIRLAIRDANYDCYEIWIDEVQFTGADHDFTYHADGASITASCSNESCTLTNKQATLTLAAPTLTTYGETGDGISEKASLTGLDEFNAATGKTIAETDIKYYKAEKSGDTYEKDGEALNAAPTDAGDYIAELTLTGVKTAEGEDKSVTASVGYTISQVETTITTAPTASEITYGDTLEDSALSDGVGSVEGSFAWKDPTVAPTVPDSQNTEYDVIFTPTDKNYSTAECKVKLTVNKAKSAPATVTANNRTYNGKNEPLVTVDDSTLEGGEMQYALGKKDAATEAYSTSIPTAATAKTYYVWYKVKGNENYEDSEAAVITVTISGPQEDEEPTVIVPGSDDKPTSPTDAKPTEPTSPTDVKPTEPTNPTDVKPTEPTNPTDVKPTEPTEPTNPTDVKPAEDRIKRLGGSDRFATADVISSEGWERADNVVIAAGGNYPDALAGAVLAKKLNAPILLANANKLDAATMNEIDRLGAKNAVILGGTAAVGEGVDSALKAKGISVIRIAGANRNDTAALISYKVADVNDSTATAAGNGKADTVVLVSNANFADALSVSPAAALRAEPILYLNADGSIPAETKAAIEKLGAKNAFIIGGSAAIAGKAENELTALKVKPERIFGADRYATSIAVYDKFKADYKSKNVCVATGGNFPDALAGGAFAAANDMPVLLVGGNASDALVGRVGSAEKIYIFGGTAAVSDAVAKQLAA